MSQLSSIINAIPKAEKLFAEFPLESMMTKLVPGMTSSTPRASELVSAIVSSTVSQEIAAGFWLYVDDLQRAHEIVQDMNSPLAGAWHAVIHRREGDFWNSKYWWRNAGVPNEIRHIEPVKLVEAVEALQGGDSADLVKIQQAEWLALMELATRKTLNASGYVQ